MADVAGVAKPSKTNDRLFGQRCNEISKRYENLCKR